MGFIFSRQICDQCKSQDITEFGIHSESYDYGGGYGDDMAGTGGADFYYCKNNHAWVVHHSGVKQQMAYHRIYNRNRNISNEIKKDKQELKSHIDLNMEFWIKHNYDLIDNQIKGAKGQSYQFCIQNERNPNRRFRTQPQRKSRHRFHK